MSLKKKIFLGLGFALVLWLSCYTMLVLSGAYVAAHEAVTKDADVLSRVGNISAVQVSPFNFNYRFSGSEGSGKFRLHVVGDKGQIVVDVETEKSHGDWSVSRAVIQSGDRAVECCRSNPIFHLRPLISEVPNLKSFIGNWEGRIQMTLPPGLILPKSAVVKDQNGSQVLQIKEVANQQAIVISESSIVSARFLIIYRPLNTSGLEAQVFEPSLNSFVENNASKHPVGSYTQGTEKLLQWEEAIVSSSSGATRKDRYRHSLKLEGETLVKKIESESSDRRDVWTTLYETRMRRSNGLAD